MKRWRVILIPKTIVGLDSVCPWMSLSGTFADLESCAARVMMHRGPTVDWVSCAMNDEHQDSSASAVLRVEGKSCRAIDPKAEARAKRKQDDAGDDASSLLLAIRAKHWEVQDCARVLKSGLEIRVFRFEDRSPNPIIIVESQSLEDMSCRILD